MEFIKALEETNDSTKLKNIMPFDEDMTYRAFKHIRKGDVSLSIQASYGHYCTPRKTLNELVNYSSMEFALIRNGEFIRVQDILPDLPRLNEIEEHWDTVYGYVPVDLIEEIYIAYFA